VRAVRVVDGRAMTITDEVTDKSCCGTSRLKTVARKVGVGA